MNSTTLRSVFVALFAAVIAAGCFIAVPVSPISPVPIVLQNMFAVLAACIMGGIQGAASVGLFLIGGALGLPIFSGGKGGVAVITGPTGGFLIGYFFAALVTGYIAGKPVNGVKPFSAKNIIRLTLAALAGFVVLYIPGVIQFIRVTGKDFVTTMSLCVLPFLPGDLIKLIVTVPAAAKLREPAARYLYPESTVSSDADKA